MKTKCKYIAFSETGRCLLGYKCTCEHNKLWCGNPNNAMREHLWTREKIQEAHDSYMAYMGTVAIPMSYSQWLDKNYAESPVKELDQGELWMEVLMIFVEGYENSIPPSETGDRLTESYIIFRKEQ